MGTVSKVCLLVFLCIAQAWSTNLALARNYTIQVGDSLELDCVLDDFPEGSMLFWSQEKAEDKETSVAVITVNTNVGAAVRDRFSVRHDQRDHTFVLTILEASLGEEGAYSCQPFGGDTINRYFVTVTIPPSVTVTPSAGFIQATLGQHLTLSCQGDGKPMPDLTWGKTGSTLPDGRQTHYGDELTFPEATKDVSGEYFCVASNGVGSPAMSFIEVVVMFAPIVTVQTPLIHAGTGDSTVTLVCSFEANPPVEVVWRQNNSQISFSDRRTFSQSQSGNDQFLLLIDYIQPRDFGVYECIGGNVVGQDVGTIYLRAEPHSLMIESDTVAPYSDQYTLEWSVQSHEQLVEFELQLQEANDTVDTPWASNVIPALRHHTRPHHSQSYVIRQLHPSALYRLKLRARNVFGYSDWTDEFEFFTNEDGLFAPTGAPSTPKAPSTQAPVPDTQEPIAYTVIARKQEPQEGEAIAGVSMTTVSLWLVSMTVATTMCLL